MWVGPDELLGRHREGERGLGRAGFGCRARFGFGFRLSCRFGFSNLFPFFFFKPHNLFEFKFKFEFNSNTQSNKTMHQHECTSMLNLDKFLITCGTKLD